MSTKKTNIFKNIIMSGKSFDMSNENSMDMMVRYILLNFLIFLGGSLLFVFGFDNLANGLMFQAIADLFMGSLTIAAFIILRTNAPFMISSYLTVVPYAVLCAFFAQSGGAQGSGVMWSFTFPMMAVFLLGMRSGVSLSVLLFFAIEASLYVPGFSPETFHGSFAFRTTGVYILILAITIVYEITKRHKERSIFRLNKALQEERDEISAMKDNLAVGLFLMDQNYKIQAQYSQALETILDDTAIDGKSFLDYLSHSVQSKELDTIKDYFGMVFNRSFDAAMLEDINPLHQFAFIHPTSGAEKTLRCSFTTITRNDTNSMILGVLQDVTKEIELQNQLSIEEGKREQEMQSLFEIIHLEPRILNDFIEDAEAEFEEINTLLKDKEKTNEHTIAGIYQSVHAIKSNAVILGLNNFSKKLHALEDDIKGLQNSGEISFNDILHLTFEIEKMLKIKDSLKGIISKIFQFTQSSDRLQEDMVLKSVLEKTISKTSQDLGKKVELNIIKIDLEALEKLPQRKVKEILTQLVRNSIFHGIELPENRLAKGKKECGIINLSISTNGNNVAITLSDDGQGLNFDAIQQKATQKGLIDSNSDSLNKQALINALFSSGLSTATNANYHAGRGVGLSLVKDRIIELKGKINIQSKENQGTSFTITIPISQEHNKVQSA